MSTRSTTLDDRYGRSRDHRRRGRIRLIVGGAVLLAAVVVWAVWTGIGGAVQALDVTTTGVTIGSESTDVQWLVTGRSNTTLVCAIEATDDSGVIVGLAEVVVPASGQVNRAGETVVRTERRATNGLIDSCRDA